MAGGIDHRRVVRPRDHLVRIRHDRSGDYVSPHGVAHIGVRPDGMVGSMVHLLRHGRLLVRRSVGHVMLSSVVDNVTLLRMSQRRKVRWMLHLYSKKILSITLVKILELLIFRGHL